MSQFAAALRADLQTVSTFSASALSACAAPVAAHADSALAEKVGHGLQVGAERGRELAHVARERGAEWAEVARATRTRAGRSRP